MLTNFEFADGDAVSAALPYHDGHCVNPDQYNNFIKMFHTKLMPNYVQEKLIAFNSGLVARETDYIPLRENNCHGEFPEPSEYKCAPANNCVAKEVDVSKGIVRKNKTLSQSLCIDPFCDEDTAMEIGKNGALSYAKLKMRLIAYSIAKFENRLAFEAVANDPGQAPNVSASITSWEIDTAYEQLDRLLGCIADDLNLDMEDLMIFSSNKTLTPIETMGKLIDNSHTRSPYRNGYFKWNDGYVGDYSGIPWYASANFPANKLYIGVRGAYTFWDRPMKYTATPISCSHGENHLWSKKYAIFKPCGKAPYFGVWDIPEACPDLDCDGVALPA